ncbi:hypothetical protein GCM10023264_10790 [Sphingomonas daechungensis]|uniref:Replication-associated protein G2P N-terminal domain-containing protein n=1 Tax=Sphingomonas daechungensis TaxID=1176646 RepID=A0ABX6T4M8_9SPHN|nr:YaaC family protein [Sphingomonas daechungensis]QNP44600.1 hypothetical protein H9L15_16090 [Sphingomonas daechungensis]
MTEVRLDQKKLRPHKAIVTARFDMPNVLTNDPFVYVDLWLRREHADDALFFWRQSASFYRSAESLPIEAKPVVLYYSFMNAIKALLTARGITFAPKHGVGSRNMRRPGGKIVLSNEGIRIFNSGVLPALSTYFGETETRQVHSLEELLYNLVHIHRTYCLTYPTRRDIFLPLVEPVFTRDDITGETRFEAYVANDVDWEAYRRYLPANFLHYPRGVKRVIQSVDFVVTTTATNPQTADLGHLRDLNRIVRGRLKYIKGASTLWYLKVDTPSDIAREQLTITLAAMHRLSELSRYHPAHLNSLLNGQRNWLLTEFIQMSPPQFIDEVAAEMTGYQILVPNVRLPV